MSAPRASVRLIRHATLLVDVGAVTFLVDPMLGSKGSMPPYPNTPNQVPNPMVELPDVDLEYDAVIVTHRHSDHFDDDAKSSLERDVPLFCQPVETEAFVDDGFTDVRGVDDSAEFEGVTIHRTPGRHGHGELAEQMGPVSGFVLEGDVRLYLAGDTVWYDAVAEAIGTYVPDAIVLNGGAARFTEGEPITMGVDDVAAVRDATDAEVIVVHMDAINHCMLTRAELRTSAPSVSIPDDGAVVDLDD